MLCLRRVLLCGATKAAVAPLIVGNPQYGVRVSDDYKYISHEQVGDLDPYNLQRTDAGELLSKLDIGTARSVVYYISTRIPGGMFGPSPTHTMATVSFNSFMFSRPVMAGDNVRISSQVIHVGNTSVAVHCEMEKQSWQSKKYQYLGESFVTFVVLDAKDITKPKTGILPAVQLNSEKTQQKCALYNTMKQQSKTVGQHINSVPLSQLTPEMVESPQNQSKPVKVPMKHTTTLVEKKFERSAININGVVFGGETLSFLEKSALHCGRLFTGSGSVFTLGMLDMTFEGPIHCEDLARCTATVVCVRRSTLLVSVRIDVDRHGKRRPTNRASFLLVSLDESGAPTEIQKGIELNGTTPEELRTYWGGRLRMEEAAKVRIRPVD